MTQSAKIYFGKFVVNSQVFYKTKYSYGLVNLKPILPGHVLVCPLRKVERLKDLTPIESQDFFSTIQLIQSKLYTAYEADALNFTIQDGPAAGQTVPHLHCHLIPRRWKDLPDVDDIYGELAGEKGDLEEVFKKEKEIGQKHKLVVDDESREPRSMKEMEDEAEWLSGFFKEEQDAINI